MAAGFFNPFPKYLQIREILLRRLSRDFAPGDRMPTEHALSDEFGVSRETIRMALRGLENDGLIRRRRGQGTFVVRLPEPPLDERLTGMVENFTELKRDTETRILEKGMTWPPADIAAALRAPKDEPIYRIRRLRSFDHKPLAQLDAFLPLEIGLRLARLDLRRTTLFRELRNTLGITLDEDYQHIDAVVADTDMAALLEVPVGAPLLLIRRAFASDGTGRVMLFQSHFRSDRYYYTVKLAQALGKRDGPTNKAPKGDAHRQDTDEADEYGPERIFD